MQDGTWRQRWGLGAGLCARLPKQEGLLKLSSSPSPDQVLGDGEGSGKWKQTRVSSEKRSGFASNRPPSVLEEVSCGQDGAGLAPSVELLPARGPLERQAGCSAA